MSFFLFICNLCPKSSLSEEGGLAGCPQSTPAGVKLEAVMEHLQRQQEAKMELNLQERHLLQAQLLFAQQAAAARASSSRPDSALFGKADGHIYQAAQQALSNNLGRLDSNEKGEDSDGEEKEMLEPEDEEEEEGEEDENGPHQEVKKLQVKQVPRFQPYSASLPAGVERNSESPPSAIKQEQEEKSLSLSPGQHAFSSPNGFTDWGYDEPFKQVQAISCLCIILT